MEVKKWFVLIDEKVQGPYCASEILKELERNNWINHRFWTRGKPHWLQMSQFNSEVLKDQKNNQEIHKLEPLWIIKENENIIGPVSHSKLIEILKSKENLKNIYVSEEGSDEWIEVYQSESLMVKLGVSRRENPRVPIEGQMLIQDGPLKDRSAFLTNISKGGFGAIGITGLSIGEKFKGIFTSPSLSIPIHFQAEVAYLDQTESIGVLFTNLSTESLAQIIAYVRLFVETHPEVDYQKIA